jgi:glycosyltransferase involved in cell wall biosynthesis
MGFAIGVCTRNRPESLRKLINSLKVVSLENLTLLVCDSSDDTQKKENISVLDGYKLGEIKYIESTPGVALQRNKILDFSRELNIEILYFLDDDVEITENYFQSLNNKFKNDKQIAIIGAAVRNSPKSKTKKKHQGKLKKNGISHGVYSLKGDHFVDWVPTLSMSIRLSLLQNLHFDERRKGNSLGEDVAFCIAASNFGKVLWTDSTSVFHGEDPYGRYRSKKNIYANYLHRILLWKEFPQKVSKLYLVVRIIVESLMDIMKFFISLNTKYLKYSYFRILFLVESRFCNRKLNELIDLIRLMA